MASFPRRSRLLVALTAALVAAQGLVVLVPASAEDKDDKIKQKQAVDQKIDSLRGELADVDEDLSTTYLALARTELEIPEAVKELEGARAELASARREDEETGKRLTSAQSEEKSLQEKAEATAESADRSDEQLTRVSLDAYKGTGTPSPVSVFTAGSDPQETVDRSMNYRLALQSQDTELAQLRTEESLSRSASDRLSAVKAEIADLKQKSEAAVARTAKAEKSAADGKAALDRLYAAQKSQKKALESKRAAYRDQQADLEEQSDGLDKEIDALIAQEKAEAAAQRKREAAQRAKAKSSSSGSSSSSSGSSGSVAASGFQRPVGGRMISVFGWRMHPVYHYRKFHAGDDFPVNCGTPVKAAQSGRVLATTSNSQSGNKLIMSHGVKGGKVITTSYHHLQSFAVSSGAHVSRGQTIAYVGTTGASTGCHLHFEVHEDGVPVDPAGYV